MWTEEKTTADEGPVSEFFRHVAVAITAAPAVSGQLHLTEAGLGQAAGSGVAGIRLLFCRRHGIRQAIIAEISSGARVSRCASQSLAARAIGVRHDYGLISLLLNRA